MSGDDPDTGDEKILAEIYPSLVRFAGVVAPYDVDPSDLVHDALVRTLERRALAELEFPAAYVRRAILNAAHNRRRSITRRMRAFVRLGASAPTVDAYPSEALALLALSPESRAVLWLADVEGLPFDEIAAELGLTTAAARQRASRGRAEIRRRLEAPEIDAQVDMRGAES